MEGFFASGDFTWFAGGEGVKITSIDDIGKDKIGGNDGDIGGNIGSDGPDTGFEGIFVIDDDATIPRGEPQKIFTIL